MQEIGVTDIDEETRIFLNDIPSLLNKEERNGGF